MMMPCMGDGWPPGDPEPGSTPSDPMDFLGLPRPGPGLLVMGFSVGSTFRELSPPEPFCSALF